MGFFGIIVCKGTKSDRWILWVSDEMEDISLWKYFFFRAFALRSFEFGGRSIYSGSRSLCNYAKMNQRVKVLVNRLNGMKDLRPNARCFRSSEYCQTPLWFIFAKMLMSGASDRSSGNRIVCPFAKFITLYMFLIWKIMVYWKGIPVEHVRICR